MIEAKVRLLEGMAFEGDLSSGHRLVIDAAPEAGGQGEGPRPLDLLLVALGGCTGMDVISILRKKRLHVTGYEVVVRAERAEEHPRVYTSIQVEHIVRGKDIPPDAVARAIQLSEEKYCPAHAMLRLGTNITSAYRVVEE